MRAFEKVLQQPAQPLMSFNLDAAMGPEVGPEVAPTRSNLREFCASDVSALASDSVGSVDYLRKMISLSSLASG